MFYMVKNNSGGKYENINDVLYYGKRGMGQEP
jgi:hypothetical protein